MDQVLALRVLNIADDATVFVESLEVLVMALGVLI